MAADGSNIVEVDGSSHEGGGQILRLATSLSSVLGVPMHMTKIRAGRKQEGLRAQHLAGVEITKDICNGNLEGGHMSSTEITLRPGKISGGKLFKDCKTAGSVCLLIQSVLPCALYGTHSSDITLRGGTNADFAPPIDFMNEIFKKVSKKFGVTFDLILNKRGFFPKGCGEVVLRVPPLQEPLSPVKILDQGNIVSITGLSFVAGMLNLKMAKQMADAAERKLKEALGSHIYVDIEVRKEPEDKAFGNCAAIELWCETSTGCMLGANALGKKGVESPQVGCNAANELIEDIQSGSCVDRHMQDQIIVLMALANGKSSVRTMELTAHTQTAIETCELMAKIKFSVTSECKTGTKIIECEGLPNFG